MKKQSTNNEYVPKFSCPTGFSSTKGDYNYWLDAVKDFWAETGLDTDTVDLAEIVNYFDKKRDIARLPNEYGAQLVQTNRSKKKLDKLVDLIKRT